MASWYNPPMKRGTLKQNGVHLEAHEFATVKLFLENGFDIELIPPSQIKGLRMPDIMLQGIPWEMKAPEGNGKYTLKNIVQSASHQSENIIIDLRRCKLDEVQSLKAITHYFQMSKRIRRIKIVTNAEKILDFCK